MSSAQINNCCQVDRQCTTNSDWVAGYYAYRNSECGVNSQQQNNRARQDSSTAQSNNCCYTGWQCSSNDQWARGYWAFRHDQCDTQAQGHNEDRAPRQPQQPRQPHEAQGSDESRAERWEEHRGTITYDDDNTQVVYADDGTQFVFVRITHPQMCALHPGLDYCQYPEHYPEIWEQYPDIDLEDD